MTTSASWYLPIRFIPSPKITKRVVQQSSPTHEVKGGEHLDKLRSRMQEKGALSPPNFEKMARLPTKLKTNLPARALRIAVVSSPPRTPSTGCAKSNSVPSESPYLRSTKTLFAQPPKLVEAANPRPTGIIPPRGPLTPLSTQRPTPNAQESKTKLSHVIGKENGILPLISSDDHR